MGRRWWAAKKASAPVTSSNLPIKVKWEALKGSPVRKKRSKKPVQKKRRKKQEKRRRPVQRKRPVPRKKPAQTRRKKPVPRKKLPPLKKPAPRRKPVQRRKSSKISVQSVEIFFVNFVENDNICIVSAKFHVFLYMYCLFVVLS